VAELRLRNRLRAAAGRPRGHRRALSNVGGVRLLWEENALDAVGAFCVGSFVLAATWMVLEGLLGISPFLAGAVAIAAAVFTLGEISRQRYPERRSYSSRHVPAAVAAVRPDQVGEEGQESPEAAGEAPPGPQDAGAPDRDSRIRSAA
jgi:hypothetical protein